MQNEDAIHEIIASTQWVMYFPCIAYDQHIHYTANTASLPVQPAPACPLDSFFSQITIFETSRRRLSLLCDH